MFYAPHAPPFDPREAKDLHNHLQTSRVCNSCLGRLGTKEGVFVFPKFGALKSLKFIIHEFTLCLQTSSFILDVPLKKALAKSNVSNFGPKFSQAVIGKHGIFRPAMGIEIESPKFSPRLQVPTTSLRFPRDDCQQGDGASRLGPWHSGALGMVLMWMSISGEKDET